MIPFCFIIWIFSIWVRQYHYCHRKGFCIKWRRHQILNEFSFAPNKAVPKICTTCKIVLLPIICIISISHKCLSIFQCSKQFFLKIVRIFWRVSFKQTIFRKWQRWILHTVLVRQFCFSACVSTVEYSSTNWLCTSQRSVCMLRNRFT